MQKKAQHTKTKPSETKKHNNEKEDILEMPVRNGALIVATSITNNLDKRVCEEATGLKIDIATAYTIDSDEDAKYKEKNLLTIVPEKLKNKKYDTLVLQGGSIEVTNIELKEENVQTWKKKVEESSTKLFNLAEESIKSNPGLKVIIVERIPRFDPITKDPAQIKSQLSKHGNSVYHNLWMNKGCPKNIKIMDLGLNCFGPLAFLVQEVLMESFMMAFI